MRVGILGRLKFIREASRQFIHVGAPQRGDGNFLVRGINRHRFERRFLGQRVHDGTREALLGLVVLRGALVRR